MTSIGLLSEIRRLEKRIEHLEDRINLLVEIADSEKRPFIYLALEMGLTRSQIDAIYDLMDETLETIRKGKPMHHGEFEDRVYKVVPTRKGDYHFAESIVRTLKEEGRWVGVYEHMKKSGMNI